MQGANLGLVVRKQQRKGFSVQGMSVSDMGPPQRGFCLMMNGHSRFEDEMDEEKETFVRQENKMDGLTSQFSCLLGE